MHKVHNSIHWLFYLNLYSPYRLFIRLIAHQVTPATTVPKQHRGGSTLNPSRYLPS